MNHIELFSGVGGFRRALDLLSENGMADFRCLGFSEIDASAKRTYVANFNIDDDEVDMGDIVAFIRDSAKMKALSKKKCHLLTGGFPCQTFSMMGKQEGFEDEDRGQMFFRILDIIDATEPKYLLLENVKNLFTHDKGRTYKRIEEELSNRGYYTYPNIYNTSDFGLPQTRNRVIIFATKKPLTVAEKSAFTPAAVKELFWGSIESLNVYTYTSTLDILKVDVPARYFLSERIKPTILADGSGNFKSKSEINLKVARPLTASMHKMHRACQDNYYSQDFIESKGEINPYHSCSKEELAKCQIRKLTPQEAFQLQGFPASFADNAQRAGVTDGALYKQAGNAVSVNTIYAIMYYLMKKNLIK